MSRRRLQARDYTVGWICALPVELAAARQMLDEEDEGISQDNSDSNIYTLGRIDVHNVVLACLPAGKTGTQSAATVAVQMKFKFTALRIGLMVGIGGGVPSSESDVRLGDVVISQPYLGYGGVVQYDFGKTGAGGSITRTGSLNAPPQVLLNAAAEQKARYLLNRSDLSRHLAAFDQLAVFTRNAAGPDVLFEATYDHVGGATCKDCNREMEIKRPMRKDQAIHYGTIASGNQVMKDGITRDRISQELGGVLCFEMEAAGLMDGFPCLVVRGICDYADSHKNKKWQPYAAATAAACAKEILSLIPAVAVARTNLGGYFGQKDPVAHDDADETAQRRIERKLDQLYEAVRMGAKPSVIFARPQSLEKELVDDNVTEVDVEENKDFINEIGRPPEDEHKNIASSRSRRPQNTSDTGNPTSSGSHQAHVRDEDDEVEDLVSDYDQNDRSPSQASDIKHRDGQWSSDEDSESSGGSTRAVRSNRGEINRVDRADQHLGTPADGKERSQQDQSSSHSDSGDHTRSFRRFKRRERMTGGQSRDRSGGLNTTGSSAHSPMPRNQPKRRRDKSDPVDLRDIPGRPRIRSPMTSMYPTDARTAYDPYAYSPSYGPSPQDHFQTMTPADQYGHYADTNPYSSYAGASKAPRFDQYGLPYGNPPPQQGYDHASHRAPRYNMPRAESPRRKAPDGTDGRRVHFSTPDTKGFSFSNPESIFSEFLRSGGAGGGGHAEDDDFFSGFGSKRPTQSSRRDQELEITVIEKPLPTSLEDIFKGVTKKMKIKRKTYDPHTGKESLQHRILEIPIKRGLKAGSKIKFSGAGDEVEGGVRDLHFILEDKPHDVFERDGNDLHTTLEISLVEALCGWHRVVQTIDDKHVKVSHPGPTPHDWRERFPGLGMPLSKDPDQRGDFVVDVEIHQPKSLTTAQKKDLSEILGRIDD